MDSLRILWSLGLDASNIKNQYGCFFEERWLNDLQFGPHEPWQSTSLSMQWNSGDISGMAFWREMDYFQNFPPHFLVIFNQVEHDKDRLCNRPENKTLRWTIGVRWQHTSLGFIPLFMVYTFGCKDGDPLAPFPIGIILTYLPLFNQNHPSQNPPTLLPSWWGFFQK